MRATVLLVTILGSALVLGNFAIHAASVGGYGTTVYGSAPIGHLQPRAQRFVPRSPAEQAEQQQQSDFDAQQQRLDEELDKRLNICNRC